MYIYIYICQFLFCYFAQTQPSQKKQKSIFGPKNYQKYILGTTNAFLDTQNAFWVPRNAFWVSKMHFWVPKNVFLVLKMHFLVPNNVFFAPTNTFLLNVPKKSFRGTPCIKDLYYRYKIETAIFNKKLNLIKNPNFNQKISFDQKSKI